MSLRAPVQVPVELRHAATRCWRETRSAGVREVEFGVALPWEPGTDVTLELPLPDGGEPLALAGRVAGDGDATRQVVFDFLDEPDRARLEAYVRERLGLP